VLLFGVVVLANGPLVNMGIEPSAGAQASIGFGWYFDTWSLIAEKYDFVSWAGTWGIGALWTPDVGWAQVRVGPRLEFVWDMTGLYYSTTTIVLGVQHFWGIVGAFGQLEVTTAVGLVPRLGIELHFVLPDAKDGT